MDVEELKDFLNKNLIIPETEHLPYDHELRDMIIKENVAELILFSHVRIASEIEKYFPGNPVLQVTYRNLIL